MSTLRKYLVETSNFNNEATKIAKEIKDIAIDIVDLVR